MKTTTALCCDTKRGGRKTPPWLWLPPHGTLAHCPQGILQSERRGGRSERKVGASSLPRNHHQRQSDGRRERERGRRHAERREKGSPPPSEQRKLLNHLARCFLLPYSSAVHIRRRRLLRSQPLFCNTSRGRSKGQRPLKPAGITVVVGGVMSGHERGLHILHSQHIHYPLY